MTGVFRKWFYAFKGTAPIETPESHVLSPFSLVRELGEVRGYFASDISQNDPLSENNGLSPGRCFVCRKDVLFEVDRPKDGGEVN